MDLLVDKKYSDAKEKYKCISDIVREEKGRDPLKAFALQKSNLCIFRLEDVLLFIYPQFASLRKKGTVARDLFFKQDPEKISQQARQAEVPSQLIPADMRSAQSGVDSSKPHLNICRETGHQIPSHCPVTQEE